MEDENLAGCTEGKICTSFAIITGMIFLMSASGFMGVIITSLYFHLNYNLNCQRISVLLNRNNLSPNEGRIYERLQSCTALCRVHLLGSDDMLSLRRQIPF